MGLFDKLLGRTGDSKSGNKLSAQPAEGSSAPAIAEREYNLSKAVSIPFTETALTGGSLMQLAPTLKALVAGNQVGNGSLVRVVFSAGIDKAGLARAAF